MARTASVKNHSVIASLVAHFASAPIAEAEQGLEIISAVVAQRKGSLGAKRGPKPGGGAAAAGAAAPAATGPQPVAPAKRKRIRNRSKAAKAAAAAAATGGTTAPAADNVVDASAPASDAVGTQALPDQTAGDQ